MCNIKFICENKGQKGWTMLYWRITRKIPKALLLNEIKSTNYLQLYFYSFCCFTHLQMWNKNDNLRKWIFKRVRNHDSAMEESYYINKKRFEFPSMSEFSTISSLSYQKQGCQITKLLINNYGQKWDSKMKRLELLHKNIYVLWVWNE